MEKQSHEMFGPARRESKAFEDLPPVQHILGRLDRLDVIVRPEEMNVPGFDFHPLRGFKPIRYSVHVNGPWCIAFECEEGEARRIDFEQYH